MNIVPIAFAFDNNLSLPAAVCIYSLLVNALPSTRYIIYTIHDNPERIDLSHIKTVLKKFPRHELHVKKIDQEIFKNAFEIRGITSAAYYRLMIPDLIPEHDKILYSDVDVIFRSDLYDIYNRDISSYLFGGVNAISHLNQSTLVYYRDKLKLDASKTIYSGNLLINTKEINKNSKIKASFKTFSSKNFTYQDMDAINLVCSGNFLFLPPKFCLTTYICEASIYKRDELNKIWSNEEITEALEKGIIHYNGQKPWKGYCVNFDIWWEYYRNSPVFNEKFYFDFFYNRINELDRLPLWKRIKILARWFLIR